MLNMSAATAFTLVLLTIATTLAAVERWRAQAEPPPGALARWLVLYVVAVVVPWIWALRQARRGGEAAAAPVMTGNVVLLAALAAIAPAGEGLSLVYVGAGVAGLAAAALLKPRIDGT